MRRGWKRFFVFLALLCQPLVSISPAQADHNNFYENFGVTPPLSGGFQTYSMSTDGRVQALSLMGGDYTGIAGDVYVSTDYGVSWSKSLNLDYGDLSVGVSPNGQYMVAAGWVGSNQQTFMRTGGYLYTSNDSGATWTQQTGAGVKLWSKVKISDDGTKIFALTNSQYDYSFVGAAYYSTNSGASFTLSKTFPNSMGTMEWSDFDMSSDGSKIFMVGTNEYLWTNIASGAAASWVSQTSTPSGGSYWVATNTTGSKVWITGSYGVKVNTTSSAYNAWTNLSALTFINGFQVSDDGKYLLGAATNDLRYSINSGTNWYTANFNSSFTGMNLSWKGFSLALSGDGQYSAADIGYEILYQSRQGANKMSAPSAVAGNLQATLSWSAPTVNSATISDYEIQQSTDGGTTWSAGIAHTASTSTTRTITSLTNGTSYTYRIAAITEWGRARFSDSVTVIPATTPGAPTSVVGVRGNQSVDLTWTAPVSNGGHAISDYTIEYRAGSGSWNTFAHSASSATSITVTGLTNGTSYTFRVSSVTDMGSSAASTVSGSVTPLGTPAAPTSFSATYGNTNSALTWTAPSDNGGSVITDYTIEYSSNGGSSWSTFSHSASTATSITITGLTNGVAYSYRVSAVNAIGTGAGATTTTAGSTLTTIALTRSSVGTTNGAAFTTQPQITLRDQFSATLVSDSVTVITASISAGGTLVGTTTATASGGIATFSNLGVSGTVNSTYTVTYSASGVSGVTQSITVSTNTATISLSLTGGVLKAEKGNAITITAAISTAGKVKFYSNGKVIAGCASRTGTSSATCAWKPTTQGQYVRLTALLIPNSGIYSNVTSAALNVATSKRTGLRS